MFGMFRRPQQPAADPRLALAVEEAIRAIDGQQENLNDLRSRVGILLSAATIATSFLGGIALEGRSLDLPGYVAVALFVLHIGAGLYILLPRGWKFQTSAQYMVRDWIDTRGYDADQMRRRLVFWADRHTSTNANRMNRLWKWYATAIGLLALEIVFWIMELGGFQEWFLDLLSR